MKSQNNVNNTVNNTDGNTINSNGYYMDLIKNLTKKLSEK